MHNLVQNSEERHTQCKHCHFKVCDIVNMVRREMTAVIAKVAGVVNGIKATPEAAQIVAKLQKSSALESFETAFMDVTLCAALRAAFGMPPAQPLPVVPIRVCVADCACGKCRWKRDESHSIARLKHVVETELALIAAIFERGECLTAIGVC